MTLSDLPEPMHPADGDRERDRWPSEVLVTGAKRTDGMPCQPSRYRPLMTVVQPGSAGPTSCIGGGFARSRSLDGVERSHKSRSARTVLPSLTRDVGLPRKNGAPQMKAADRSLAASATSSDAPACLEYGREAPSRVQPDEDRSAESVVVGGPDSESQPCGGSPRCASHHQAQRVWRSGFHGTCWGCEGQKGSGEYGSRDEDRRRQWSSFASRRAASAQVPS